MLSANSNFYQGNFAVVQDSYDIMGMFYRDKLNIIICMKRTNTGVVHCSWLVASRTILILVC